MTDIDLDELLLGWLPAQRWYGGKGRSVAGLTSESFDGLPGDGLRLVPRLVTVTYADGGRATYQVPLAERTEPWTDIDHALIGQTRGRWLYDAVHDPAAAALLLDALRAETHAGGLAFHRIKTIPHDLRPRLIGADQSNSSLVYGEELIVKLFRRVEPGLNPDLELTRALQDAGSPHVAPIHGWYEAQLSGQPATLGLAQEFQRSATEGWKMATASVRDLYDEADLHAEEVGGDFAAEALRLGRATAEVHAVLRDVLPTKWAGADATVAVAAHMHERLNRAVAEVGELEPYVGLLRAAYDELGAVTAPVLTQRIHGDLHLGQVLRTDHGWLLLDFEGEPARPLAERSALMSPLRDVAGMLRSFEYAARSLLADQPAGHALEYRAAEWAARNRAAFCDGYATAGKEPRDDALLLRAFELDKAVYEVVYEARHRPSWLPIPLRSIERLAV